MSTSISLDGTTVIFDGHTVGGWSEDSDALMMPDVERAQISVGADGLMIASRTGHRGGEVQLKLQANSESAQFFGREATFESQGGMREWAGTIRYSNGAVTRLERGVMTTSPLALTLGQGQAGVQTFVFYFERIITNYDAGRYSSPPTVRA